MSGKPSSGGAPLMHARQYLQGAAHQVNTRKLETWCERHILNAHWLSLICFLSFFILLCRLQTPSLDVYPGPTNRNGPTELSMLYLIHWCPSSTHLRRRKTRNWLGLKIPYFPHIFPIYPSPSCSIFQTPASGSHQRPICSKGDFPPESTAAWEESEAEHKVLKHHLKWMVYNGNFHWNGWFGGTPV